MVVRILLLQSACCVSAGLRARIAAHMTTCEVGPGHGSRRNRELAWVKKRRGELRYSWSLKLQRRLEWGGGGWVRGCRHLQRLLLKRVCSSCGRVRCGLSVCCWLLRGVLRQLLHGEPLLHELRDTLHLRCGRGPEQGTRCGVLQGVLHAKRLLLLLKRVGEGECAGLLSHLWHGENCCLLRNVRVLLVSCCVPLLGVGEHHRQRLVPRLDFPLLVPACTTALHGTGLICNTTKRILQH